MTNMKYLILLCIPLTTFNSLADEFSDAQDAYINGDYITAIRLYEKLVKQGNPKAQNELGYMYKKGDGTPQDYKEAIKWFTKSAEQGDAYAQYNLGFMYDNGKGIPQDYKTAIKWYTKSADQGHINAQFNLGNMYGLNILVRKEGVLQNHVKAHMFWNIAAASGHQKAKKYRDKIEGMMTPNQIRKAQQLAREWMEKY